MSEWISIFDDLPADDSRVDIVRLHHNNVYRERIVDCMSWSGRFYVKRMDYIGDAFYEEISADFWMYSPKMPPTE